MASVVFLVRDINKAASYYRNVLGFDYEEVGVGPVLHVHVHRNDAGLTIILHQAENAYDVRPFSSVPGGPPWDAFAYPADVQGLFDMLTNQGADIAYNHIGDAFWSEFAVRDWTDT